MMPGPARARAIAALLPPEVRQELERTASTVEEISRVHHRLPFDHVELELPSITTTRPRSGCQPSTA
jgi:hypothetical protein